MDLMSQRKTKILNMNHGWLRVLVATLVAHPIFAKCDSTETVMLEESEESYFSIPSIVTESVSVLHLSYKNITLNETDRIMLHKYRNVTELYLNNNVIAVLHNYSFNCLSKLAVLDVSNNSITIVEQAAFVGTNKLAMLYLQNNKISQLDSNTFVLLENLKVLNLQNNNFLYLDIKLPFNSISITLSENPWNCSCGLLRLQSWLNNPNITIEYENSTVCDSPNSLKTCPIKTAFLKNCEKRDVTETTTAPTTLFPNNDTLISATGDRDGQLYSAKGFHPPGKSWTFLIGVLVVIVGTTTLIIIAIKFPVWYRYLISYNHSRLEEEEPEMFEETFTSHIYTHPQTPGTNKDDSVVVFEQFHTFVPEEDGFIEDQYIES
nr:leucine-rich repeat-containing protein 19 [Pogona vitticeps]